MSENKAEGLVSDGPVVCDECNQPLDGSVCGCEDGEPSITAKAKLIAHPTDRTEYPVHWNDEVAEAFLQLSDRRMVEARLAMEDLQHEFNAKLADITRERHNRLLLQVATPLLAAFLQNVHKKDVSDKWYEVAAQLNCSFTDAVVAESIHYAAALMAKCELLPSATAQVGE